MVVGVKEDGIQVQNKIRIMPKHVSSKIAAGEVVERPASILKELVENAIDAGAEDIEVELVTGGIESIRVVDNGEGMGRDDIVLAFERFATSKITTFDDLTGVRTFGFRGEALPSIAAVARVEVSTRTEGSVGGTRAVIERGKVTEIADVGCSLGTTITVTGVFGEVPARRKFLKSEVTERSHCVENIVRCALSRKDVRFSVSEKGRTIFTAPKTDDTEQRIARIIGPAFIEKSRWIEKSRDGYAVHGYVSSPEFSRSNTKGIYCFVNGRYVRDTVIHHALMKSYRRFIEAKRYPHVVVFVDVPPGDVDVNVHPAKIEVRFARSQEVYGLLVDAVTDAFSPWKAESGRHDNGSEFIEPRAGSDYGRRVEEAVRHYTLRTGMGKEWSARPGKPRGALGRNDMTNVGKRWDLAENAGVTTARMSEEEPLPGKTFSQMRYAGEIDGTYLVLIDDDGLVLVDKHVAHERVLYERLKKQAAEASPASQELLMPQIIELQRSQAAFVLDNKSIFEELGFSLEHYGGSSIAVKSVPVVCGGMNCEQVIADIGDELERAGTVESLSLVRERVMTVIACKGAVKAHDALSADEIAQLCRDLDDTPYSSHCPHGRPVSVRFGVYDLERIFKRR